MGEKKNNIKEGSGNHLRKKKTKNKKNRLNQSSKSQESSLLGQSTPSKVGISQKQQIFNVLSTPSNVGISIKQQILDVFQVFGIEDKLPDRLKNNMFIRNRSPSKMKSTRKKDLMAIGKALLLDILNLIHPQSIF